MFKNKYEYLYSLSLIFNNFFWFFGLELKRKQKHPYTWLQDMHIDSVLDIWANSGQFLSKNLNLFPDAKFHSFEPLPYAYSLLKKNFAKHPNVKLYNIWLWSEKSDMVIHESDYNPSSSFLEMTDIHKNAFPHTKKSHEVKVRVEKLDDLKITSNNMLVKIDTQWYEMEVILWWLTTIKKAKVCIIETSFYELYKWQPLFADIYNKMISLWFVYAWAYDQLKDPLNGSILQQDMIFIQWN